MKIAVLNAQRTIFEGVVSEAVLPAADGELSILDDHEPIFVALGKGAIRLKPLAGSAGIRFGTVKPIPIHRGLARMRKNELVIMVE